VATLVVAIIFEDSKFPFGKTFSKKTKHGKIEQ